MWIIEFAANIIEILVGLKIACEGVNAIRTALAKREDGKNPKNISSIEKKNPDCDDHDRDRNDSDP